MPTWSVPFLTRATLVVAACSSVPALGYARCHYPLAVPAEVTA